MKVLVIRIAGQAALGGAELSARDQVTALSQLNHHALLLSNIRVPGAKQRRVFLPLANVPAWLWRILIPFHLILLAPQILTHVWIYKPDIINAQSRYDQLLLHWLRPLHRRTVVWKDAGDMRFFLRKDRQSLFGELLQKHYLKALSSCNGCFFINQQDRQHAKNFTKLPTKAKVIKSDILFSNYDIAVEAIPKSKFTAVTIARLTPEKNVAVIAEAARKSPNIDFWVVGDGPLRKDLEDNKPTNLHLWGNQATVESFLAAADIYIQPSLAEPWGRTIKEALLFGLPIIASEIATFKQQLDQAEARFFTANDANQLTKLVKELEADPSLRDAMSKAARAKAHKLGDFTEVVKTQIIPLYEEASSHRS